MTLTNKTLLSCLALTVALPVLTLGSDALADEPCDPEIELVDTKPADMDDWWQWAAGAEISINPVLDPTGEHCAVDQGGGSWYLAGTFGGEAERSCTMPAHTRLTFPLVNALFFNAPGENYSVEEMYTALDGFMGSACDLYLLVDGEPVTDDLAKLRLTTERPFDLDLPADNVFGVPAGTYGPSVADGYYATLEGLPPGSYELEFGGAVCDGDQVLFSTAVSYELTVE
jgi:hypothetical protein